MRRKTILPPRTSRSTRHEKGKKGEGVRLEIEDWKMRCKRLRPENSLFYSPFPLFLWHLPRADESPTFVKAQRRLGDEAQVGVGLDVAAQVGADP